MEDVDSDERWFLKAGLLLALFDAVETAKRAKR